MAKQSKPKEVKVKIDPPKGRPMLYWVGKQALDYAKGFPARLMEVFDPAKTGTVHSSPIFKVLERNWQNLLFHGDNKEVLATLLENGFRGKIDLIYIDPPFDSGADYLRKVELRGIKGPEFEGEDYTPLEQTMYFDTWKNDAYLQWMYERLQLLKELLSDTGSIYVHLDYRRDSQIRLMMDEIFGEECFQNEIIWHYKSFHGQVRNYFPRKHDTLLFYRKSETGKFTLMRNEDIPVEEMIDFKNWGKYIVNGNEIRGNNMPTDVRFKRNIDKWIKLNGRKPTKDDVIYVFRSQSYDDVWDISYLDPKDTKERTPYPTQKPERLLERIIKASSTENDLILDCFIGSGTTAVKAQELGRRWIGCDINKGAIQTTAKRLQKIVAEQLKGKDNAEYPAFATYQVNDYDLKLLRTEAIELAVEHIGIERRKTDPFFDGLLGKELVKIIDFNHPLTLLDLQLVQDEIGKRKDEERNIVLVCLGKELAADKWIEDWNKKHPVNKMRTIELRTDKKYGKFLVHEPDIAKVSIKRKGDKAIVAIQDFVSPTIIERLNTEGSVFKKKVPDFRAMIDSVLIDPHYDGKTFRVAISDVPEKKSDYVVGQYEIDVLKVKTTIAIKITDMLGEEVFLAETV